MGILGKATSKQQQATITALQEQVARLLDAEQQTSSAHRAQIAQLVQDHNIQA